MPLCESAFSLSLSLSLHPLCLSLSLPLSVCVFVCYSLHLCVCLVSLFPSVLFLCLFVCYLCLLVCLSVSPAVTTCGRRCRTMQELNCQFSVTVCPSVCFPSVSLSTCLFSLSLCLSVLCLIFFSLWHSCSDKVCRPICFLFTSVC